MADLKISEMPQTVIHADDLIPCIQGGENKVAQRSGVIRGLVKDADLDAHKASADHDTRYYTKALVDQKIATIPQGPEGPAGPAGEWVSTWTVLDSSAGLLDVPLDGGAYEWKMLVSGTELVDFQVTLPASDATTKQYGALVKILPPDTGTAVLAIPTGWGNLGPLESISLSAGNEPIYIVLETDNDDDASPTILFTAKQREIMP